MKWINTLLYKHKLRGKYRPDVVHRISNDANLPGKQLALSGCSICSFSHACFGCACMYVSVSVCLCVCEAEIAELS